MYGESRLHAAVADRLHSDGLHTFDPELPPRGALLDNSHGPAGADQVDTDPWHVGDGPLGLVAA